MTPWVQSVSVEFEPALSSHFIIYLRDYLLDKQQDLSALDGFSNILDDIDDADQLPVSVVAELYDRVGDLCDTPYLGLEIGKRYHYESAGLVILLMLAAPSVEKGIQALVRYDRYFDTAIEIDFQITEKETIFSVDIVNPKSVNVEHIYEYLLVILALAMSRASRKPMPCKEVWFSTDSKKSVAPLEAVFNCPVRFGKPSNRIVFSSSYLREKFYTSNSRLFDLLSQQINATSMGSNSKQVFLEALCRVLVRQCKEGTPTLDSVADKMNISGRTMRRRLAEQNYTFQEVKNLAREQQARYYLNHTNMSLSSIALELGFSELSAFSRAFRSWTGSSPQSFRE